MCGRPWVGGRGLLAAAVVVRRGTRVDPEYRAHIWSVAWVASMLRPARGGSSVLKTGCWLP